MVLGFDAWSDDAWASHQDFDVLGAVVTVWFLGSIDDTPTFFGDVEKSLTWTGVSEPTVSFIGGR